MLVKTLDGSPINETEFRNEHSETSFPRDMTAVDLSKWGAAPLFLDDEPELAEFERAKRKTKADLENGKWVLGWDVEQLPVPPQAIKNEATRRILNTLPEWKQRNLMSDAARLLGKGRENWDQSDQSEWEQQQEQWGEVARIRAASDRLEEMSPVPRDFREDIYWQ